MLTQVFVLLALFDKLLKAFEGWISFLMSLAETAIENLINQLIFLFLPFLLPFARILFSFFPICYIFSIRINCLRLLVYIAIVVKVGLRALD